MAGTVHVRKNITQYIEADMLAVADMADRFISSELELLRMRARNVAHELTDSKQEKWAEILTAQGELNPHFAGLAVLDKDGSVAISSGKIPAHPELLGNKYIQNAFSGRESFTSTIPTEHGVMFYLAAPIPKEQNRILVLTIDGLYFSELTAKYHVWETGHIFIDDNEGYIIANTRHQWVQNRQNFIIRAQSEPQYEELAGVITNLIGGQRGVGYYAISGVRRICAYRPISGSPEGWVLGIVAPLTESPVRDVDKGLLIVGLISFLLSVIAAVIASNFIKKPFEQVVALKEEAQAHSRSKSAFLANMSHELRTPLNVIIGLTDLMLEEKDLPEYVTENHLSISNAGGTLLSIVNDILDISKIESGKLSLVPVEYHIPSLLNDTVILISTYIGEKPVDLKLNINETLPSMLYGDELRIKQIMNNLLSNAVKYTNVGTVELGVSYECSGDEVWLTITVKDTGMGIKEADIKNLFKDYFQIDKKANRKIEGTGLGLSITHQLVHMMGGHITVESEYGKGSTFTVKIRQGFINDTIIGTDVAENLRNFNYSCAKRSTSNRLVRVDLGHASVLVVDDIPNNLDVAAGLMRKYNMTVHCVTSGQMAVDIIRKGTPSYDAIFMDHMMPEMDGIEAAKAIRALDTEYSRNIPIIALTANAIYGAEQQFFDNGFQDFLSKPIDIIQLDAILKKWVRSKTPQKTDQSTRSSEQKERNHLSVDINISGIDPQEGISRYGNDTEVYLSILRSFAGKTPALLDKLRDVGPETLRECGINAHGLKGSSGNISAFAVSKAAARLESAAKNGDFDKIKSLTEPLLKETELLIANINAWFEAHDRKKTRKNAPDREVLESLLQSCKAYDMSGIDNAMDKLEAVSYDSGADLVAWLREKIDIMELNDVIERLSKEYS
jgi:signal transduction histidine kinase/FixJ family two-component response regulator/HPt (histidine-containing phosphotransfer) domain-containing protein